MLRWKIPAIISIPANVQSTPSRGRRTRRVQPFRVDLSQTLQRSINEFPRQFNDIIDTINRKCPKHLRRN